MVELDCTTARPGGVTLVAVRLDNRVDAPGVDAHRIRLVSAIDGATWPPRVQGVPAAPWDGDAAEVVVPTGRVGSLGFASPEPPADPPVTIESVEPAAASSRGDAVADDVGDDPTADDVLRVLGDPSPPRDAVAPPSVSVESSGSAVEAGAEPDVISGDSSP
ncbi:DUF7857 domain-containing protein [Salinarchaeum laminariae]|uniref:DUF7857 domain-containing protein n=1 Tax=Salinarchaeum laminariae TaxID=869888 RepID=UPI0020BF36B0|nr:hypothetical protein [Salinarchaeum laminariae]